MILKESRQADRYFKTVDCQIDTGSQVNVVTSATCQQLRIGVSAVLRPPSIKLRFYDGFDSAPLGECIVRLQHRDSSHNVKFVVIDGKGRPPLISTETCKKLNLVRLTTASTNGNMNELCPISSELVFKRIRRYSRRSGKTAGRMSYSN